MRIALAVLAGLVILGVGLASVRSLTLPRGGGAAPEPEPDPGVRVLYYCEACGAEVLVLARGSGMAPRHCGEAMHRREERRREA